MRASVRAPHFVQIVRSGERAIFITYGDDGRAVEQEIQLLVARDGGIRALHDLRDPSGRSFAARGG